MKHLWLYLALLLCTSAFSYKIEGIFPNSGPTTGDTRVTIYSPTFKGMNSSDHPNPRCKFPGDDAQIATWIHCYGSATNPSSKRDQTCLNCESPAHSSAGNVSVKVSIKGDFSDTATINFYYYVQPTVSWAVPPLGYKTGGTFVQVYGQDFLNVSTLSCSFGTINVRATYVSSNMITCRSPSSDVVDSAIPIRVSQNNQQYSASKANYYYHTVPEVSVLTPHEGPTSGGNEVYVVGRQMFPLHHADIEFRNSTFAKFGTDYYAKLEIINKTHGKTYAPSSVSASPVPVEITFNNQEWTHNGILYHYYQAPYVVKLVPNIGVVEGGTVVTAIGANLKNTSEIKCRFGDHVVPGTFLNETAVSCVAPRLEHVGPYDFGLAIEKDHFSGNPIKYLAIKKPVIKDISPSCGPTTGGTEIAVIGENFVFTGNNKVFCIFGDVFRQPGTVINETLIYCDAPRVIDRFGNNVNDTDSLHLKLTLNNAEVVDSKLNFNYYSEPIITSMEPKIGVLQGGTQVTLTGRNFERACGPTCRFGTAEVPAKVSPNKHQVVCVAPPAASQGDSLVQLSLNGKQYPQASYANDDLVFTQYQPPIVAYSIPSTFPTDGESSIGIYGNGFLLSKDSAQTSSGATRVFYQCKFTDGDTDKVLGIVNSTYFNDYYIHCVTPKVSSPRKGVNLEISPNGQSWIPVPNQGIDFYNSPVVTSIDPKFGKVKQKDGVLTVNGQYFICPNDDCSNVQCAFTSPNFRIVTNGTRQSSEKVYCQIPSVSMPEQTNVQVTMNGVDYTPQKVNYTFYDAFVISLEPSYIPVEGNTPVHVKGYGFADTSQLKVKLQDSRDQSTLVCGKSPCVLPATYVSPTEITFTAPPQNTVKTAAGAPVNFIPIEVEASVYGDNFTENNVQLNYYQNPTVSTSKIAVNSGAASNVSYEFHANDMTSVFIPINVQVPEGVRPQDFLRKTRPLCRYDVGGQQVTTEGKFVEYPYPADSNINLDQVTIQCATPHLKKTGKGSVSVSLNGANFVGNVPINVIPQLQMRSVQPACGPIEGGSQLTIVADGIQDSDLNKLYFSWSSVCTNPLTANIFTNKNTLSTITPPAASLNGSGGASLLAFGDKTQVQFEDNTLRNRTKNHVETSAEFLYYRRPIITRITPHGGVYTGGTPVVVEGAYFFQNKRFGCTPKCRFGNTVVEAEYISTVRLRCASPPGTLGAFVPFTVTINGQDVADTPGGLPSFTYISRPNIDKIYPSLGPATGGTMIEITGQGFVDMSQYPEDFVCIFTPVDLSEPAKVMPASYLNSTTVTCSTPGGWLAGTTTNVELSFNGVDFSNSKLKFRFYQITRVWPLSGPSSGGSQLIISGSGLIPEVKKGKAGCKFGGTITEAVRVTQDTLECQVPQAPGGPTYDGHVDLYYTLDGEKWEQIIQGFTYYQQPTISEVNPKFISANGGRLKVKGDNFRANFFGANLTCRIDHTTVPGQFVSNDEIVCPFGPVEFSNDLEHHLEVSLNNVSFTPKTEATKINVFKVSSVKPPFGLIQGGTSLLIDGQNFPLDSSPICVFGTQDDSISTKGTLINSQKVTCPAPALPVNDDLAILSFKLTFGDLHDAWDDTKMYYQYYAQPEVLDVVPREANIEESILIRLISSARYPFNSTTIASYNSKDFDVVCRFGRLGTTSGDIVAHNQVVCPTPSIQEPSPRFGEEYIEVEVSINGQDFTKTQTPFKFIGPKTHGFNHGMMWLAAIVLGAAVLIVALYIIAKVFDPTPNAENDLTAVDSAKNSDPISVVKQTIPEKVIV